MAQWLRGSDGRLRWAPGDPDPAEAAANEARLREMIAARQAPAPKLWSPESTVTAAGRTFESRRDWESFKAARGLTEDRVTAKRARPTSAEMFKTAVADAEAFLYETGQYVQPGTPTTEATKAKIARGEPVLERMPEPVASPAPSPVDPPGKAYSSRNPWGFTGDKGDALAWGKENALARAEGRPSSLSREA